MKTCTKCGIEKPLDEFYKHKGRKDGHASRCKDCCKEYEHSPQGLARRKKWYYSEKGQTTEKIYRQNQDPKISRAYTQKYRNTKHGKKRSEEYTEKYRTENSEKYRAGVAVMHAVQSGKLVKPSACEQCGKEHYYINGHHTSYEKKHWLDVIWLCPSCHKIIHLAIPQSSLH